ncbi:MAG TPA: outer membrane beta-barrel protein [Burkholderiales bacterium]|nr:outer membrane beta-barrel protein [Burkholderiales bacterium]
MKLPIAIGLAATCALAHAQTDFQVSAGVTGFRYKEYDEGGVLLDQEDASLPGITLELGRREGPWRISVNGSYFSGTADYGGQTQTGVPANTNTDEQLWSAGLRLERQIQMGSVSLSPYLGFGYHEWRRDIKNGRTVNNTPVNGLLEIYSWKTAELGALLGLGSWQRFEVAVDARVFRTVGPELEVRLPGDTRDTILQLGERTGGRLALLGSYPRDARLRLRLEVFYEQWSFGRSPPRNGVLEPDSDTQTAGVLVGLIRSF